MISWAEANGSRGGWRADDGDDAQISSKSQTTRTSMAHLDAELQRLSMAAMRPPGAQIADSGAARTRHGQSPNHFPRADGCKNSNTASDTSTVSQHLSAFMLGGCLFRVSSKGTAYVAASD
jgi:hypothetical protein